MHALAQRSRPCLAGAAWRDESAGRLTLATAACALEAGGSEQAVAALGALSEARQAEVDTVANCWARMAATGSGPWSTAMSPSHHSALSRRSFLGTGRGGRCRLRWRSRARPRASGTKGVTSLGSIGVQAPQTGRGSPSSREPPTTATSRARSRRASSRSARDFDGARVVLKPNFVEYDPGSVVNTDPRVVAGAVEAIRRMGAESVTVAEGPGHRRDTGYVVAASGLLEVLRDVDAPFADLNVAPATPYELRSFYHRSMPCGSRRCFRMRTSWSRCRR